MKLYKFASKKQQIIFYLLLAFTVLNYLIFKEKYIISNLIEFILWIIYFIKQRVDDLLIIQTIGLLLSCSVSFFLFSLIELSEHALNAGLVFILVFIIIDIFREVECNCKNDKTR